ncbi:hypothetical protein NDU88_009701, partial [Pleurodeles waltl]
MDSCVPNQQDSTNNYNEGSNLNTTPNDMLGTLASSVSDDDKNVSRGEQNLGS